MILSLWIGSSYAAKSQTTDTLCFPIPVIQKVLIDAKQKKLVDSLNTVLRSDVSILQSKIGLLQEKNSNHLKIEASYQSQVNSLEKSLRKQKAKTKLTAIGGLILSGLVTGLFIFK